MSMEKLKAYNEQLKYLNLMVCPLNETEELILPKDESIVVTVKDIRDYLEQLSRGIRKYVVIETQQSFTVVRLVDNASTKAVYKMFDDDKKDDIPQDDITQRVEHLQRIVKRYFESDLDKLINMSSIISQTMVDDKVIPYSYLQRCTSTLPLFKRYRSGATNALKTALLKMCDDGLLIAEKATKYGSLAQVFKVI